jgi:glycosyltransferase involved in cell wall biosynthesis
VPLPPRQHDRDGPLVIGAVGRLDAMKGFDLLLHAVSRLSDVRVIIVGEGDERPRLERLAAEQGISNRVSLPGWDDNPRNWLSKFDVFTLPSRSEGFPLTLVEAMFAGLPIIASQVGSVAEAVTDEETGLLVEPGNVEELTKGLARLRDNPSLRQELGAKARVEATQKHTAERMAKAYLDLWIEVIARPPASRLRVRELKA